MKVLEDIRFEKSLPRENRMQILTKVSEFITEYYKNIDPTELNRRFSVKKVYGTTKIAQVWKFKVNDGDRVLYTKGKYAGLETIEDENTLILLRFCSHDEQIIKARRLFKILPKELDEETLVEESVDREAQNIIYNPEKSITRVFKHIGIEALINLERLQGIYYLNEKQRECVNTDYRPLILFGSAGSGKTTIGVYKLIDLIKQNPNIRVGYFTYSNKLAKTAKKIYQVVLENELEVSDIKLYEEQVDFHPLKDWIQEEGGADYILQYDQFNEQFYIPIRQNLSMNPDYKDAVLSLTSYEVWREIRGLIKGYAGDEWLPHLEEDEKGILSETEYMKVSKQHSVYTKQQRKVLYAIALKYMSWQKQQNILDENDLCRKLLRRNTLCCEQQNNKAHKRYDWIVIDEVQDLTELEIYLLQTYVKESGNFLLSGDYHQTIAPTYFNIKRIMTLLEHYNYRYKEDANKFILTHNYRNPKQVVELANQLSQLRRRIFGKDKRNDYSEEIVMCRAEGSIYTLCENKIEKHKLLSEAIKKAYVYIVVATEEEREILAQELGNSIRIFTIYEVKGLENRYIIGVNLLSNFKKKWEEILRCDEVYNKTDTPLEENYFYRYLMNMLYVTFTRTQKNLCFIEDEVNVSFIERLFKGEFQHEEHFDIQAFDLEEDSNIEDFYREAQKYEAAEEYQRAIQQYEKLRLPKAKIRESFCRAKLCEIKGDFNQAGIYYKQAKEFQHASRVYKKAGNYKEYYVCLIKYNRNEFMKEVLLNKELDYARDLKPYMTPYLEQQIEALYIEYYNQKLKEGIKTQEDALIYIEIINEQIKAATIILE